MTHPPTCPNRQEEVIMKYYRVVITGAYYVEAENEQEAEQEAITEAFNNPNNDYDVQEISKTIYKGATT